jgi:regulator of nonsense transcripts 2
VTPSQTSQIPSIAEPGSLSRAQSQRENEIAQFPQLNREEEELVEQDLRERFKRMCEGYFDNVCKKLVIEHKVGDMPTSKASS